MPSSLEKLIQFTACASALGRTRAEKWRIFLRQTKNLRVRLGLARYHPDQIYELPTRYGTLFLRDNFGDVTNLPDLFHRNVYRYQPVPEDGVVVDVGANIGLFAAWVARHDSGKKIYCIEPLESNARLIPLNCPGADVSCLGLGRVRETVQLRVDGQGVMASHIEVAWPADWHEFEVVSLDEFAQEKGIENVAFLKIDTEGMELAILEGGQQTLRRTSRVAMETHSPALQQEAMARLRAAGFIVEAQQSPDGTGLIFATKRSTTGP